MSARQAPGLTGYALASLCMADVIAAHELDLREWLVLDFLRRQSFGAGQSEAYIPRLDLFAKAVQISRGNISAILKRLKQRFVIEERPQWFYGFMFPVANWKLPVRLDQVEVIKQLALFDNPEHIRDEMRQSFVEQCEAKPGWPGLPSASGAPNPGVPELGTPAISRGRTRFGYGPQTPAVAGSSTTVPESGTGHACMQQCSNVPEGTVQHVHSIAACGSVPESGTLRAGGANAAGGEQLSPEQQRLFDALGRVGAYGAQRTDQSRACWFGMVKSRPRIVEELLGEFKYAMVTRPVDQRPKKPGAWMMNKWQHWGRPDS